MNEKKTQKYSTVVSVGAGSMVGAVTTSSSAMTAAGAGAAGVTGYVAGIGVLAAHAGCEVVALVGIGSVLAGPIMGGILGYGLYRGMKKVVQGERC